MDVEVGFKQTEVGVIPEDWRVRAVGEISDVKTGPFGSLLHERDYVVNGTPIITVEHLQARGVSHVNLPQVSDIDTIRLTAYSLREGDIVFSRVGSVDRNALIRSPEDGWLFSGRLLRIRPHKNEIHAPYLSHHFHSEPFKRRVRDVAVGQTMASINTQILKNVMAVIPTTKAEQEAIAEALSDADALIESLEQLIAKKRQIKQGAMQELLTGQRRLSGFSGEWEAQQLGSLADFHKGKGLPKSAIDPFGDEECIHYGELFTHYPEVIQDIKSRTNGNGSFFRASANDVLMPTSDVTPRGLAKGSCIMKDGVVLGGDILVIRPNKERVFGPFLSYLIRFSQEQVLQLVTGSTVFHLYAADMKKFNFSAPEVTEQIDIVNVLSDMENEIAALKTKLTKARQIKQGLMQELLTGRIRLV